MSRPPGLPSRELVEQQTPLSTLAELRAFITAMEAAGATGGSVFGADIRPDGDRRRHIGFVVRLWGHPRGTRGGPDTARTRPEGDGAPEPRERQSGPDRYTSRPGTRRHARHDTGEHPPVSFEDDLRAEALTGDRDEAYAGIHRIARAAGLLGETHQAQSISEVCDLIAAWCTARRADTKVTGLAGDLWALLEATDTDYLSTGNLPELEERIARLTAAVTAAEPDAVPAGRGSAAAALKAALATSPLSPPADVFTAILTFAAEQIAAGGPMWRLRCSPDIVQAHRFPGVLGVEVMRDWLAGRWELADAGGQVIVTSGGGVP